MTELWNEKRRKGSEMQWVCNVLSCCLNPAKVTEFSLLLSKDCLATLCTKIEDCIIVKMPWDPICTLYSFITPQQTSFRGIEWSHSIWTSSQNLTFARIARKIFANARMHARIFVKVPCRKLHLGNKNWHWKQCFRKHARTLNITGKMLPRFVDVLLKLTG